MSPGVNSLAVIGGGYWGRNLVRNFSALKALRSVVDTDIDRARGLAHEFGVGFDSYERVLADPGVRSVAISTPSGLHHEQAKAALTAGKHVFIEKPMAFSAVQAVELVSLAADRKRCLMVGHLLQFHPAFQRIRSLVADGVIGNIRAVVSNRLSAGQIRESDDALWDLAPHDISMICALLGHEPVSVEARGSAVATPSSVDIAHIFLAFPGAVEAHVAVSRVHPFKEQRLLVCGDKGTIVFEDSNPDPAAKLMVYPMSFHPTDRKARPLSGGTPVIFERVEPLRAECHHFLQSMENGHAPLTDGREGLNVVRILEKAAASIRQNSGLNTPVVPHRQGVVVDFPQRHSVVGGLASS